MGAKFKKNISAGAMIALALIFLPAFSFAQTGDPPADGCDPFDGCPVPLDTWVMLLAVLAIAYGAHRLHIKQHPISG